MEQLEAQIAAWRMFVGRAGAVDGHDVEELEAHLRDQVDDLTSAGLTDEEAFLVAVGRMGSTDTLSREYAREHSGRLWKQLVLAGGDEPEPAVRGWLEAIVFAVAAAITIQVALRLAEVVDAGDAWLARNLSLLVLPFLAAFFARRRRLGARGWAVTLAPFAFAAVVVNLLPFGPGSSTELLVAMHLPVALWFALAYPYTGGDVSSHERRMDVVRFTGEWIIYFALIALGGGVLLGLTGLILEPIGPGLAEQVFEWVLPSGAAGAVIIAAWLVESKQRVVENMAPVLTMIFTPLFAVMLLVALTTYVATGLDRAFDRELLGVFDALMVVVLGLVLYTLSARDPSRPAGLMDRVQFVVVVSALLLDVIVLGAMLARIGEFGFTPNRTAVLGLNLVLLGNLVGTAWLSGRFLAGRGTFHRLERWQTSYLPVFAVWAAAVVLVLPPLFAFA